MRHLIFCECGDLSHHVVFEYDPEMNELTIRPKLTTELGFFGRLREGLRYILGMQPSRFGVYDVIIVSPDDARSLALFLDKAGYDLSTYGFFSRTSAFRNTSAYKYGRE